MRPRYALALTLIAVTSTALAADLVMRPGRWEVSAQMDFGGRELPAGIPLTEPMTSVTCISEEDLLKSGAPMRVPPGCKVSEYKSMGRELTYTAQCEDATVKYNITMLSADSYVGVSTSHGKDPSQTLTLKFKGQRAGDACSAEELAEEAEDMEELEDEE